MLDFDCLLLSGSSGAIGSFLLRDLSAGSYEPIYCLLRNEASFRRLRDAVGSEIADRIRPAYADVTDAESVAALVGEIGTVQRCLAIHCAADVSWTKSERLSGPVNVDGTRHFANLAVTLSLARPSIVFLSTAFCADGYPPRNAYEATKLTAEKLLRAEFSTKADIAIVKCSLVVGAQSDGWISRFNGIYPLIRILALAEVPCLISNPDYCIDCVPVDFVSRQVIAAAERLRNGTPWVDLVVATGTKALPIQRLLQLTVSQVNEVRSATACEPLPEISIITERQFKFLMSASKTWSLMQRFAKVEEISEIMAGYIAHGSSSRDIEPVTIDEEPPSAEAFIPSVLSYWIKRNQVRVLTRLKPEWLSGGEGAAA